MRPTWDVWWLHGAIWASERGECIRRQVGALVVKDNDLISQGYNGAPAGRPSCLQGACPRARSTVAPGSSYDTGPGTCIAIHGEANALLRAGRDARGATLYVSCMPCDGCLKLADGAGIIRTVWPDQETGHVLERITT